ncbi:heptaprenylglyceryl phosphate synthase [Cytobacillus horneckiae]|uniref:Heptaprenylglyceryl phosphate synthase n=1 Tax=Cytobacillus horneckiae TaxID=549687 RepID=A0A2N0ZED4_9BACI|nr:heptaprenylglyceryl phosphate synthase [Cytobacillus horneckiae]NRG45624.1 heptaprenylglyceryl phosphate synthase [Bacillus sp. CRN 9]MBN6889978.1 heptaprenylglyceryl phosphate synthase [Cytobacillus horneckiae]MCM3176282.1 heptaprenylglyceryl phosphate synthase [Cytobacillus horneckiae]MEC1159051.1 heptaprenylglyceryl phosphate synthase [Cytobacillus horneckiae]MED2936799.1 heptaprenylglyceryl phosphate synthase [Cytobacillus horneckiae]
MYDVREWSHVFKLDPNKAISDEDLEKVCESGTDAVIIGGTDGITLEKVLDLMARVRRYTVPCVLEVSTIDSITPGYDLFFIPTVLNSNDTKWVKGLHHEAVREFGEIMNWDEILVQGYCILNEDCKVAQLTNANTDITAEDVKAYAMMAEKMFHLPIFYIEYSGKYGEAEVVKQAKSVLSETVLFYGGGITNVEQAREMSAHADVVVVGNVIYDDIKMALKTVQAVKQ